MIPLLIEPSNFSFNLNFNLESFNSAEEEKIAFSDFIKRLNFLFDLLEKNNLKIALNREIQGYIFNIPGNIYLPENKPFLKIANELFFKKISKLSKIMDNDIDGKVYSFSESTIDITTGLHNTEEYLCWGNMITLILKNVVFPAFIKGDRQSIFLYDSCKVFSDDKELSINTFEYNSPLLLAELVIYQLFNNNDKSHIEFDCSGTGTHDSMWGNKVRNPNDLPLDVRELLYFISKTGILKEVKLLEFYNKSKAYNPPILEFKSIDAPNVLECILKSNGTKQNTQRLMLILNKDYAQYFYEIFKETGFSIEIFQNRFFNNGNLR